MTTAITDLNDYFDKFGALLGAKAAAKLNPLFHPDKDQVDNFDGIARQPFPPQAQAITAMNRTLDHVGAGYLVGEMGTGKTLMGMLTIHKNAKGQPYRAIVLCPDHLISVWREELAETIPNAEITTFDNWRGVVKLLGRGYMVDKNGRRSKRWPAPIRPEWYIVGRDQAKYKPDFLGVGEEHKGYDGNLHEKLNLRTRQTGEEKVYNDQTRQFDKIPVMTTFVICPKCGDIAVNDKGGPLDPEAITKKQTRCQGFWLDGVHDPDAKTSGRDRLRGSLYREYAGLVGKEVTIEEKTTGTSRRYKVVACNEPLWQYAGKPYRWPPAMLFQKKLKKFAQYLVIDEVHEQKSDESAQSLAAGKLMASVDKILCLTGTLIGGYAHHLFPLLMRTNPATVREDGHEWGKLLPWSQAYGRVDRIVKTSQGGAGEASVGKRQTSMRKARTGRTEVSQAIRPGVMPTMYGKHMLGQCAFISLSELEDELPNLDEIVADGACDMDPDQKEAYDMVEKALVIANQDLLSRGSIKLLSTMLWTTLDYADKPYGWEGDHEGLPTVGYYDKPNDKTRSNWHGVVTPPELDREKLRPKERKLLDICLAERAEEKQVWVYCQMTGKRDVQPRLKKILEAEGLRVAILRSGDVSPRQRKEWIDKNASKYDVIISNPRLVSTGLTLFDKGGSYNFPTLVYYQTGFNLFELRQASRRSWRIGQPHDCKVYYLYYKGTMQERAMMLMSRKMSAAAALDGKFSTEGLVGLAEEDSAQIALARSINEKLGIDPSRGWSKSRGPRVRPTVVVRGGLGAPSIFKPRPMSREELDALDDLPVPAQPAATATLEVAAKSKPKDDVIPFEPRGQSGPSAEDDEDDEPLPRMSREQLAKMFADLAASGVDFDEM